MRQSRERGEPVDGAGYSRGQLLKRLAVAGGAVGLPAAFAWSLPRADAARPSPADDERILNFLLLLEYVQERFYAEAAASAEIRGELGRFATTLRDHEREHIAVLERALGAAARTRPTVTFGNAATDPRRFARAALELEEAAAAGYIGQGANLTDRAIRQVVGIVSVEARHAAWIRDMLRRLPAPRAADRARSAEETMTALEEAGFAVSS